MADVPQKSFADKLQSISKPTLFLILILCTSLPLFFPKVQVPNEPEKPTIDLYQAVMQIPEGKTVLLASDWTNSTHGESGGQFKSLMRILMRKKIKVAIYTSADPQAPKVARDNIRDLNKERTDKGEPPYQEWNDWVSLGFYPAAEGLAVNIGSDVRKAFEGKKATDPATGVPADVFTSPVLKDIKSVKDFPLLIVMTASNTAKITLERLYGKVPLAMMVTGVMGPETQVYYDSGQLVGLSKGLKGVYDLEILMDMGSKTKFGDIPAGFPGAKNRDQGSLYYPTLHVALFLLIVMVVIGNVGMALSRRKA
jgi:hypothetical protein